MISSYSWKTAAATAAVEPLHSFDTEVVESCLGHRHIEVVRKLVSLSYHRVMPKNAWRMGQQHLTGLSCWQH